MIISNQGKNILGDSGDCRSIAVDFLVHRRKVQYEAEIADFSMKSIGEKI